MNERKETSEKLGKLPENVQHDDLSKYRISYKASEQLLVLEGVMKKEEKDGLLKLSVETSYQEAIERLFQTSRKKVTRRFLEWAKLRYDEFCKRDKAPYRKFSNILSDVKEHFKNDSHFEKVKHIEQAWKTILGTVLEGLIEYSIEKELEEIDLKCAKPTRSAMGKYYRAMEDQLSIEISNCKLLPDADRVIYQEDPFKVIAILSIKKKFRERIAQVGYWTIQLRRAGKDIKNIMVTTDENGTFTKPRHKKDKDRVKAKAIAQEHTNGTFVATEAEIEENGKVKRFDSLINCLKEMKG